MRYLLDTSALLAHYRQEPGWEEVHDLFVTDSTELSIASVSLTEFGRRLQELGASEAEVETTLASYQLLFTQVIAIDAAVAKAAFVIGHHTPHRLPLIDALIAACAQAWSAVLVHRDEHMRAIPEAVIRQHDLISKT
jgi:predicted nucleic acid-binding protein